MKDTAGRPTSLLLRTRSVRGISVAIYLLLLLTVPSAGEAVPYVKSVEYVEVPMGAGTTTATVNLTKGQVVTNSVPFASLMVTGADGEYNNVLTDIFFAAGPSRVTVQRATSTGTVSLGVYVVEFDPAYVNVLQGTFSMANGVATTTAGIAPVILTKAALVSYYRHTSTSDMWRDYAVAGWFSAVNQLSWQRESSSGAVNGHYFVFEARNSEFRVQPVSFGVADGAASGTAPITAVDMDKTFIIASHRTIYDGEDNEDGQVGIYLQNPTTLRADRQWVSGSLDQITDIRAFVVELDGGVRVQRGSLSYANGVGQQTAAIRAVQIPSTMVWNGSSIGPGTLQSENNSSGDADTAFQRLKLANATTVQGDRDGACGGGACLGIGQFEVVEWNPSGATLVKSGFYTGNNTDNRPIFVDFQPDVVLVKYDVLGTWSQVRTSTMPVDATKSLNNGGLVLFSNAIQSFTADGFVVGTDPQVNSAGVPYYWVAFKASPGELVLGTYTGNNIDNRNITGVGFQPELVWTLSAGAGAPLYRSSTMTGDTSYDFLSTELGPPANSIQALQGDGFQVGNSASVNGSGVTIHYVAWNTAPGRMAVGSYAGDGSDDRPINAPGFQPEWVVVKQQGDAQSAVHKPASTGVATDYSLGLGNQVGLNDGVQALHPLGFEVGTDFRVNSAGPTYHWMAFGPHLPQVNHRSIGTAAAHGTGTISVNAGSVDVTGAATTWVTSNRGRGDVLTVPCPDPPVCTGGGHFVILGVSSNTALKLVRPYTGTSGSGLTYLIRRQFTTLAAWEDCIDGPPGTACTYFPVISSSLPSDDRSEVGIAYKDSVFTLAGSVTIDGNITANTDASHTITLTADGINRHYGLAGQGVVIDNAVNLAPAIEVFDNFVTVEWLSFRGGSGNAADSMSVDNLDPGSQVVLRYNLMHNLSGCGIEIFDSDSKVDVYNNVIYLAARRGIRIGPTSLPVGSRFRVLNNTIFGSTLEGVRKEPGVSAAATLLLRNNLVVGNLGGDFNADPADSVDPASSHNLASDTSASTHSPAGGGLNSVTVGAVSFVSTTPSTENLHIQAGSAAQNVGTDLSHVLNADIDAGARIVPWDIGADDIIATTEVELLSFEARAAEGAVDLYWRTGSELKNLGFHLHRGPSLEGPWERITPSLIAGLGSSPAGARYSYRDSGLANGATYFYLLEDVETTGKTRRHGPVFATPAVGAGLPEKAGSTAVLTYGEPSATSLRVISRGPSHLVIELSTGGFHALSREDGSVALQIPGFVPAEDELALPMKPHWLEAVAGRKVEIQSIREAQVESFSLRPSAAERMEMQASWDGTQRLGRSRAARNLRGTGGLVPRDSARIASVAFQGEVKKALLEMAPLRWDRSSERLLLARKLVVTVAFRGREPSEVVSRDGRRGRREIGKRTSDAREGIVARFVVVERGLHAVRYEDVFGAGRRRGVSADSLRLSRLEGAVAFHVEPASNLFAPGSRLYFISEGAEVNPYGKEAIYELEVGRSGERMRIENAAPEGNAVGSYLQRTTLEEEKYYQAGLLEAPDLWLWEALLAPAVKSFPFSATDLGSSNEPGRLDVFLQGASDFPVPTDHHVRVLVNGTLLGEDEWNGKEPRTISVALPSGILREGDNDLEVENLGDTGALYSMVFLDRFAVTYSRSAVAEKGSLEGTWSESGVAEIQALGPGAHVLDVTGSSSRWLAGARFDRGSLRFRAEAGRSYLAVERASVERPQVRPTSPVRWRHEGHSVDYLAIGPVELLDAALPLLERRRGQGLRIAAVPIDDVFEEMGHGERRPEAIRELISYAYHHWQGDLRYVLLLGDASYDFEDHLGTGAPNAVPALPLRTTYLWTASDPALAAVNGDDLLPDLAIGRLPAADASELRIMVEKILAYETGGASLQGPVVLVTDNPDSAGDFDRNAFDLASSALASRPVHHISLGMLGASATREAVLDAFDRGASLLSYMGHGGIHLWASENVFDADSVALLAPQSQQPLTIALDCLNGYFHFPYFDSLAEELLKAEAKGSIAVIAPSGLSLNDPAHVLHQALYEELLNGRNPRLGDAVMKAQESFLQAGSFPELLAIYHLFGDPALVLR